MESNGNSSKRVMTKSITEVYCSKDAVAEFIKQSNLAFVIKAIKEIQHRLNEIIKNNTWIKLDKNCYYVPKYQLLVGDCERENFPTTSYSSTFYNRQTVRFTLDEARDLFYTLKSQNPMIDGDYTKGSYRKQWVTYQSSAIYIPDGRCVLTKDTDSNVLKIPSVRMSTDEFQDEIFTGKLNIIDNENALSKLSAVGAFKKLNKSFEELTSEIKVSDEVYDAYSAAAKILGIDFEKRDALKAFFEDSMSSEKIKNYIDYIVNLDCRRAGLDPYDPKCIEDINRGCWDLWDEMDKKKKDDSFTAVKLTRSISARNPLCDIKESGLIGIDFGTRSTIVSCLDSGSNVRLMRIGSGDLGRSVQTEDYENPTVIEFIDLAQFMQDYNSDIGRPRTSIEDITVSHKAYNSLSTRGSELFYSFMSDLKQWCGDSERSRQLKMIDQKGREYILPPYLDENPGCCDPVEIYAYYLGLFINNMHNGIYLNYMLSFPVTYSKAVRDKLLESFTCGLKKSLPNAVIEDEEAMNQFSVESGVSEPAAYAICALKGYGFEPEGDQRISYGIFDFGGGTTDFDFGIWRSADEDKASEARYDYVIEHFGSEGDRYLGGENLLNQLAYEVFKANTKKLRKQENDETFPGFTFSKPAECSHFPGDEVFISNSQEAKRNIRQLSEQLRPLWEGILDFSVEGTAEGEGEKVKYSVNPECRILDDGFVKVGLYDRNGVLHSNFQLDINHKNESIKDESIKDESIKDESIKDESIDVDLLDYLEKRIDSGVKNFFEALKRTFRNAHQKETDKINIFLAGNSSRSPIVLHCFETYIKNDIEHISKRDKSEFKTDDDYFTLFPPLGTEKAIEIQRELGVKVDENDIMKPTGKTGVAYGLIEGRKGGTIKVISEKSKDDEIKFSYYIGRQRKGKFQLITDRDVKYNEWHKFKSAVESIFELYYSPLPEVATSTVSIDGISKKRCRIDRTDENAVVVIRAVKPTVIEYAVAENLEKANSEDFICQPVSLNLT